ncbi:hypothetical protein [Legionella longbeachae]|uniref:Secreted protein n=1 Tax=Legionella longbeachae serogroup 1 (strain NSW150) TaxID=661367 RepID=D3HQJ6_LEGLN|nr:hypothetical protein [Legionella longbeachae]VEE01683.1 Uncharacterised protein [Legionella oakridgensis]HBD7396441.1 hypothetical protein [Legionella pneumophila]ARB91981.1 hypothetical protein A6J40_07225 [Legionella longbeachae]ARM34834.1 hypothetical protein B0B39_15495 [Legionella longbeachae]EEZ95722.1 conserved hypothetical protein [Legionella longbeachae D-4968]
MKLKSFLFAVCFGLFGHAVAANQHMHPNANEVNNKNVTSKPSMLPGYCEIEVRNSSYEAVFVDGFFDDRAYLQPFVIPVNDDSHFISLYYRGSCHYSMQLRVAPVSSPYYFIYDQWTRVGSTVHIVPYLANGLNKSDNDKKIKVEVTTK